MKLGTCAVAATFASRVRGLLLRSPDAWEGRCLLLVPCDDVHTWGMRHAIDLAFVDDCGRVVASHREVGSRRRMRCAHAFAAVERFSADDPWFSEGDELGISSPSCWSGGHV